MENCPAPNPTEQVRHLGRCADPVWFCVGTVEESSSLAFRAVSVSTWEQLRLGVNSTRFCFCFFFLNSSRTEVSPTCPAVSCQPTTAPGPSSESPPWCLCPDWPRGGEAGQALSFWVPCVSFPRNPPPLPLVNGSLNIEMPGKTKQNKIKRRLSKR